ncbi:hypothetical protein [Streptomyces sp. IB2014 011-1]|uniref:hypothetical protein n=1 Tax=Streptomyces sp. IB2014 011-1 TaxID=1844478 RepID=UPI00117D2E69|nr:hypothetical protein [Streptomyces sp. IB2014 011-1]
MATASDFRGAWTLARTETPPTPRLALRWLWGAATRLADRLDPAPDAVAWAPPGAFQRVRAVPGSDPATVLRLWSGYGDHSDFLRAMTAGAAVFAVDGPDVTYTLTATPVRLTLPPWAPPRPRFHPHHTSGVITP